METIIKTNPVEDLSALSRQELEKAYIELKVKLTAAEAKNDWYVQQYRLMKQKQFGSSSEKGIDGQLSLADFNIFNEAEAFREFLNKEPVLEDADNKEETHKGNKSKRKGKKSNTKHLPEIVEETFRLSPEECNCPQCGGKLHEVREDITAVLEVEPARVYVHKYPSMIYSCRQCEKDHDREQVSHAVMIKAKGAPEPLIKGSMVSPSLFAHTICEKFVKAVPFYRQESDWKRTNVPITRNNMCNWTIRLSNDWLELLTDRMDEILKTKSALHCDETEVQVLSEPGREATSKSRVWVVTTMEREKDTPMALYYYTESRSRENAQKILQGFEGYVHCDDYSGYDALLKDKPGYPALNITLVTCLVHILRYFKNVIKAVDKEDYRYTSASKGILLLQKAFDIDNGFNDLSNEERMEKRQALLKPALDDFFAWAEKEQPYVLPKCTYGKSINHAINNKEKIYNVLKDGICELDNSMAERAVKPFVIGRKNWLFSNTPAGAKSSCVVYSLIETAKMNNLVPFEYIKYVLETMPKINVCDTEELDVLLPWSKTLPGKCYAPTKE